MIKVIFCLPGRTFSNNFLRSWTDLLLSCSSFEVEAITRFAVTSNVYSVRNLCLMSQPEKGSDQKPFQGQIPYDYIMWIDSDSVFEPLQFASFLDQMEENKNLHILSGVYLKEFTREYTAVLEWKNDYFRKYGRPQFLTPKDLKGKTKLIKVEVSGMGFMMVRFGVFEKITYPWFQPMGISDGEKTVGFTGEDASFCIRAKEAGFDTWIDPKIVIGHEKPVILR